MPVYTTVEGTRGVRTVRYDTVRYGKPPPAPPPPSLAGAGRACADRSSTGPQPCVRQVLGTNPDPTDFSPQAAAEFQRSLGHLFGVAPEALRPCYCRRSFVNPEPVFVGPTEALLAYFMAHPRPDLLSVSHGVAGARIVVRTVDGDGTPGEKAFDMRPGAQYALYTRLGNGQMACVTPHETFKRDRRLLTGDDLRTGAGPAVGGASEWVSRGPWQRAPGDSAQRVPADVVQALPGSAGQVLPRGSGRRVSDSLSEPPTTDPVREPPPPPRIRWRRGRQLGEGAFGTVYQALDTVSGRLMAVKTIRVRNPLADVDQYKAEVDVLQRYAHPNIVQYLGLEEGPGPAAGPQRLCIFLEYVAGGTIAALLREYGAFPERVVQRYTGQILAGLAYLHRSGVVHRDVKGANILVTDGGVIKLADFGASCRWKEVAGENPMMVGTAWCVCGCACVCRPPPSEPREQGGIRGEGASEAAPAAVRWAVGGGCRGGWGR